MEIIERIREPDPHERGELRDAIRRAAEDVVVSLGVEGDPLCHPLDTSASEHERRRAALAMVRVLTAIVADLEQVLISHAVHTAGEAGATYADIGAAAGMSRQAARNRWPGAVPNAQPGRPALPATTKES